jgi:hypothetical protein
MAVDLDGLPCPLHHPMAYSHQTSGQCFLSGTALSHRAAVGVGVFPGGVKPRASIFCGVLTVWVPVLPNFTWSKPFLLGHTYPMSESS